ncbi:MAG: hypothetical protein V1681_03250 [Candidatus Neomarinimicrobiota bacterium]
MENFHWTPVLFWLAVGLTLFPAGLAVASSNVRSIAHLSLITHFGIFTLLISLGAELPAIIYLILNLLLTVFILYGIDLFPIPAKPPARKRKFLTILPAILSAIIFLLLVGAFYFTPQPVADSFSDRLQPVVTDQSLLLVLTGMFFVIILISAGQILRKK